MNDGKIIIDKILNKANADADAIAKKAQSEADLIEKAGEQKAKRESEILRKKADEEAEKIRQKAISGAKLQSKIVILKEKQKILEEVKEDVEKRLNNLSDADYKITISNMLKKLNKDLGEEIIVSKEDKKLLAEIIKKADFKLSDEEREIGKGFILKNGDIEYNYTFNSILDVEKEELKQIAAEILF